MRRGSHHQHDLLSHEYHEVTSPEALQHLHIYCNALTNGLKHLYTHDYTAALACVEEAQVAAYGLGDVKKAAAMGKLMSVIYGYSGYGGHARDVLTEVIEQTDDPLQQTVMLASLAAVGTIEGDLHTARLRLEQALKISRQAGKHLLSHAVRSGGAGSRLTHEIAQMPLRAITNVLFGVPDIRLAVQALQQQKNAYKSVSSGTSLRLSLVEDLLGTLTHQAEMAQRSDHPQGQHTTHTKDGDTFDVDREEAMQLARSQRLRFNTERLHLLATAADTPGAGLRGWGPAALLGLTVTILQSPESASAAKNERKRLEAQEMLDFVRSVVKGHYSAETAPRGKGQKGSTSPAPAASLGDLTQDKLRDLLRWSQMVQTFLNIIVAFIESPQHQHLPFTAQSRQSSSLYASVLSGEADKERGSGSGRESRPGTAASGAGAASGGAEVAIAAADPLAAIALRLCLREGLKGVRHYRSHVMEATKAAGQTDEAAKHLAELDKEVALLEWALQLLPKLIKGGAGVGAAETTAIAAAAITCPATQELQDRLNGLVWVSSERIAKHLDLAKALVNQMLNRLKAMLERSLYRSTHIAVHALEGGFEVLKLHSRTNGVAPRYFRVEDGFLCWSKHREYLFQQPHHHTPSLPRPSHSHFEYDTTDFHRSLSHPHIHTHTHQQQQPSHLSPFTSGRGDHPHTHPPHDVGMAVGRCGPGAAKVVLPRRVSLQQVWGVRYGQRSDNFRTKSAAKGCAPELCLSIFLKPPGDTAGQAGRKGKKGDPHPQRQSIDLIFATFPSLFLFVCGLQVLTKTVNPHMSTLPPGRLLWLRVWYSLCRSYPHQPSMSFVKVLLAKQADMQHHTAAALARVAEGAI
ncbi:unnamed protein product [Vitrella brassicaformis CCMP3155]|uniref:Uncharacterized protein n=3 Tax=Vitrella brassicaformis TaxID=1169539 RepID=A0A0G4FPN2_VITBC|nr:unnamed protein product [Vitrella brassicaformis CCMP3155]|eukprot:CEM15969.1 unnamed protein product [Vitrella brassicaformis CCMP3155]